MGVVTEGELGAAGGVVRRESVIALTLPWTRGRPRSFPVAPRERPNDPRDGVVRGGIHCPGRIDMVQSAHTTQRQRRDELGLVFVGVAVGVAAQHAFDWSELRAGSQGMR